VSRDAEEQFERVWAQPTEWRALSAVNNSVVASRFLTEGSFEQVEQNQKVRDVYLGWES
jgi:ABC-type uncharacterized transport system ATPase subunit